MSTTAHGTTIYHVSQALKPAFAIANPGTLKVIRFAPPLTRSSLAQEPSKDPKGALFGLEGKRSKVFPGNAINEQTMENGVEPLLPPPDDEVDCTAESWINPDPSRPDYFYHGSRSVTDQPIMYIAVEHWLYMNGDLLEYGYREKYNDYLAGIWEHDPDDNQDQQFWEVYGHHHFVDDAYGIDWHPWTYSSLYH